MLDATLTTLRQRGSELIADAEESLRHHIWDRATASAALAGAYFAAYTAMSSTRENLTETGCPACADVPCACAAAPGPGLPGNS